VEKINKIRSYLKKNNLDGYFISKNDEFFNEYISENKDILKKITKFTGSYGFALILIKKNFLFVDGRYTLQAIKESGRNFNIVTIPKKMPYDIFKKKKLSIGFNPKLHTENMLANFFKKTHCKLISVNNDFTSHIKIDKKKNKLNKFFVLNEKFTGEKTKNKIFRLSKILKKDNIDLHFITSSQNIAWLINLRGGDSEYSPIPNGYLVLNNKSKAILFCDLTKIDKKLKTELKNISILDIQTLEKFLLKFKNKKILIDSITCSVFFKDIINRNNFIVQKQDPIYLLKSQKNKIEIKNMIQTHIEDGAALTKFLFWLKNNFKKKKITEISAQDKLLKFRKENKLFYSLSFPTISGTGSNGAIIHYRASKKSNKILKKGNIYLVDSGAQYKFGTTDVTRTISLDNSKFKIKNIFTRVLKGHIAVARYKIINNTNGDKIDTAARKYLKDIGLDYAHGTGHGVGYFLDVHEGPQAISRGNKVKLKEGMVLSNEPGFYKKGEFGIRIENLIFIKKNKTFHQFQDLTLVPIDKSLIEKNLLNKSEITWLNNYHSNVFKKLKKYMNKSELINLKNSCSFI
jgi:Xaa-Pro aminopeptidase